MQKKFDMDSTFSQGDNAVFRLEERPLAQCADTDVPPCVGTEGDSYFGQGAPAIGRSVRVNVRPGLDLLTHDVTIMLESGQGIIADPCLAITLLLDADGHGSVVDPDSGEDLSGPIAYARSTLYVSFSRRPLGGRSWAPAGSRYRLVEFRLSHEFLNRLGIQAKLNTLDAGHPMHQASNEGYWVGVVEAPADMIALAEQIHTAALSGDANDLALDARALDFLDSTLRLLGEADAPARDLATARLSVRIMAAQRLINEDPAFPWTLEKLARAVGLTGKKLKHGFRALLGTTVISYLKDQRLRLGHTLLLHGGESITEISLRVGYANPSHFTQLYRRRYGETPKATRRGH